MAMKSTTEREPTPTNRSGEHMAAQFTRELLNNDKVMAYVAERGIKPGLIEQNRVGFVPPYSHHWFPLLKGRVVVPIRDVSGSVVAFAGRQFEPTRELTHRALWDAFGHDPAKAKDKVDKWDRGKWINETFPKQLHLYQLHEARPWIRQRNYVVLVEGYFDALVLASKGLGNTAAICGTALSDFHAALLKRYCDHVVLLLDPDEAGATAVEKARGVLENADLKLHAVRLPAGHDPDEFVIKYGGKPLRAGIENMIADEKSELIIKVS